MRSATRTQWRTLTIALMAWCTLATAQVVVNDEREFRVDAVTDITLDGDPLSLGEMRRDGDGYVADYIVDDEATDDLNRGWLRSLYLRSNLIGPVTSRDPLSVLGIPVVVTDDTILRNVPADEPDVLPFGSVVLVSGYPAENSAVLATRLALKEQGHPFWRLSGYVAEITADTVLIGRQLVAIPDDIGTADCEVGDFAIIRTAPNPGFELGDTLEMVDRLRCGDSPFPPDGVVPAAIEGFVDELIDDFTFTIGRTTIATTEDTVYVNGDASDVQIGARLEAQGPLQLSTRTMQARRIKFRDTRIEARGPVTVDDYLPGESITLLGIRFLLTDIARDELDEAAPVSSDGRQVQVRGFVDASGQAYATRVRAIGEPDYDDVGLRGVVGAIDQPLFDVVTATVDTSDSDLSVRNVAVTQETFFELLRIGTFVEVDDASFDPSASLISGGSVEIKGRRDDDIDIPRPVARVVARGPVGRDDIDPRRSITVLGLKFHYAPGSRDDEDLGKGDLPDALQVEVEALLFGADRLVLLDVRRLGEPNYEDVKLLGPLTRIQRPEFSILRVEVDGSESEYALPGGAAQFFEEARIGRLAVIDHATWNPSTGVISEGVVDLRVQDDPFIDIKRRRVRARGPAGPDAVGPGASSITVLGIRFQTTPLTEDPDGLLTGGLTEEMQLAVRGTLIYPDGLLLATSIRARGLPAYDDVELRGPAGAESPPTFGVLGTTIDTTGATLISRRTDRPLTPEQFFAALDPRDPVHVDEASWDPNAGIISGGTIALPLFDEDGKPHAEVKGGHPFGVGTGTITKADAGLIFANTFE